MEVIGDILTICAAVERPYPGSLGWIRLGQICATLRQILLDMSHLWASAVFKLPAGNDELLKRAQDTPLVVDLLRPPYYYHGLDEFLIHRPYQFPEPLLHTIAENLPRAHTITLPSAALAKSLSVLETKDFPFLKNVKLVSTIDYLDAPLVHLSLARAPLLRQLAVQNCLVSCDYSILESLNLRFHMDGDSREVRRVPFDARATFKSIGRATHLRRLTISGSLFVDDTIGDPITLPHLEDLHIRTPYKTCCALWNMLSVPPTTRISVYLGSERQRFWGTTPLDQAAMRHRVDFIGAIAHHFDEPNAPRISGIRLECSTTHQPAMTHLLLVIPDRGAVMRKLQGRFSRDHGLVLDVLMTQMDGLLDLTAAAPLACLNQVGQQTSLPYPVTLELLALGRYSTAHWVQGLCHLDAVQTLSLDEFPPRAELWDAICPSSAPTLERPLVLPRLRVVYIVPGKSSRRQGNFLLAADDDLHSESSEDEMPELETVLSSENMEFFLQGDARMYERYGYESGEIGETRPEPQDPAMSDSIIPYGQPEGRISGNKRSTRPALWGSFVAGLQRRAELGSGLQRITLGPNYKSNMSADDVLRFKSDVSAVVPEIVEMPFDVII